MQRLWGKNNCATARNTSSRIVEQIFPQLSSIASAIPMILVSIMYPAVIMLLRSVGLLMQMILICLAQMAISLVSTSSHTAGIILCHEQTATVIFGTLLLGLS